MTLKLQSPKENQNDSSYLFGYYAIIIIYSSLILVRFGPTIGKPENKKDKRLWDAIKVFAGFSIFFNLIGFLFGVYGNRFFCLLQMISPLVLVTKGSTENQGVRNFLVIWAWLSLFVFWGIQNEKNPPTTQQSARPSSRQSARPSSRPSARS